MTEINSMPIKVMYDEDSNPFVPFVSLEAIGEINGENINEILDAKLEADNIKAGNQIDIEVKDGDVIIHNSATGLTVIDNLDTENPGEGALDARQGKVLKDSIPEVVNNLNTIDSDKALSAHQGYILAGRSVPVGGAEGQVLKKSADNDYALEWGDAADPNAIIGDGSIKKIVELTYNEYLALKDLGYLDSETEYHINDWTESGLVEVKAEQVIMSDGFDVEEVIREDQSHIVNLSNRMDAVENRLENKDIVDEGQNTRLDIAEGNIDGIVTTVNSHANSIGTLTTRMNNLSNTVSGNIMTVYSTSSSKDDPRSFTFGSGLYLVLAQVNGNHMGRVDMVYGAGSSIAGYTTIKEPSSNVFFEYSTNSIKISSNYTCMIRILRMPQEGTYDN